MAENKLVFDIRSNKDGISQAESNEQQRNWSEAFLKRKAADPLANYDPTRTRLNFEVTRGGIIQPPDTSKSIMQKMAEILEAREIKDPNARENVRRRQNTLAQIMLGGSRDRMNEIAFGNQPLNLAKGADNSSLTRERTIEEWSIDAYNFIAKEFGEENIVSFYVHLDELNVHAHCTLIPMNKEKNKISWRTVFGKNKYEGKFDYYHDRFAEEVGKKWGLERGDSVKETGARHRSTAEYKRDLVNEVNTLVKKKATLEEQISRAETKLKGISTMIENQQKRKEEIDKEIELIAQKFGAEGADTSELANRMKQLREEKDRINETLLKRFQQLEDAQKAIAEAKSQLEELANKNINIRSQVEDKLVLEAERIQAGITETFARMELDALHTALPALPKGTMDILENSGIMTLSNNSTDILNCAMMLAVNYIAEATTYAESCGGSGGNMSGWGRNKDEDDERWWMRCITKAASMVKPNGRRVKIGR